MTREELKEHCKRQILAFERIKEIMPVTHNEFKHYEEHKLVLELLEQQPCEDSIVEWKNDFKGYVNSLSMPKDDYNGIMEYIDEVPVTQQPCKMTVGEYRHRMIDTFHNADCDNLIALVALPSEMEFEHLEWLLKNHYHNQKQQPCEDCISKQSVDTLVDELARAISDERCYMSRGRSTATIMQDILDLPPVTPKQQTCEDAISRQAVLDIIMPYCKDDDGSVENTGDLRNALDDIESLPPVTLQPKTGHWILSDVGGNRVWHCNCSECGKDPQDYIGGSENWWMIKNKLPKYCPSCGIKMEEVGNDT